MTAKAKVTLDQGMVMRADKYVHLGPRSFKIFSALWYRRPRVATRSQIILEAYDDVEDFNPLNLGIMMYKLRETISPLKIEIVTCKGHGFAIPYEGEAENPQSVSDEWAPALARALHDVRAAADRALQLYAAEEIK